MQSSGDVIQASPPAVYYFGVAVAAALLWTGMWQRQEGEEGTHQYHCGDRANIGSDIWKYICVFAAEFEKKYACIYILKLFSRLTKIFIDYQEYY